MAINETVLFLGFLILFGGLWMLFIASQIYAEGNPALRKFSGKSKLPNGQKFNFSLVAKGLVFYLNTFSRF